MKKILLTLLFIYIISGFILPVHAVHYYYKQIAWETAYLLRFIVHW